MSALNEKVGYDVLAALQQSAVVVKGKELYEVLATYCTPSALYIVMDTLRLSLQVNELVGEGKGDKMQVSPFAEVVFYLFIAVWILIFVTSIVTFFGQT